ncbi:unnamed protein product [Chrysoparadoxa australica]
MVQCEPKLFHGSQCTWELAQRLRRRGLRLLGKLRKDRGRKDESWLQVGRALYAVDRRLQQEFTEWSKLCCGEGKSAAARVAWERFSPYTNVDLKFGDADQPHRQLIFLSTTPQGNETGACVKGRYTEEEAIALAVQVPSVRAKGEEREEGLSFPACVGAGDWLLLEGAKVAPSGDRVSHSRNGHLWVQVQVVSIKKCCILLATEAEPELHEGKGSGKGSLRLIEVPPAQLAGALVMRCSGEEAGCTELFRLPRLSTAWGMEKLEEMARADALVCEEAERSARELQQSNLGQEVVGKWKMTKSHLAEAGKLLSELSCSRGRDRGQWLEVGEVLYAVGGSEGGGGDARLLDAWVAWTERAMRMTNEDCRRAWSSFHPFTSLHLPALEQAREFIKGEMASFPEDQPRKNIEQVLSEVPWSATQRLLFLHKESHKVMELPAVMIRREGSAPLPHGCLFPPLGGLPGHVPGTLKAMVKVGDVLMLESTASQHWLLVTKVSVLQPGLFVRDLWNCKRRKLPTARDMASLSASASYSRRFLGLGALWGAFVYREQPDSGDGAIFEEPGIHPAPGD